MHRTCNYNHSQFSLGTTEDCLNISMPSCLMTFSPKGLDEVNTMGARAAGRGIW